MAELEGLSKSLSFDPNIPIEEQMINIHRRVDEDQHKALVEHWKSEKLRYEIFF